MCRAKTWTRLRKSCLCGSVSRGCRPSGKLRRLAQAPGLMFRLLHSADSGTDFGSFWGWVQTKQTDLVRELKFYRSYIVEGVMLERRNQVQQSVHVPLMQIKRTAIHNTERLF